jgi:hypothetical protein
MYTLSCGTCGNIFRSTSDNKMTCIPCGDKARNVSQARETKILLIGAAIAATLFFSLAPGIIITYIIYYIAIMFFGKIISTSVFCFLAFIFSALIYGVLFNKKKDWKQAGYTYLIGCGASTVFIIGVWIFFGDSLSNTHYLFKVENQSGGYDYSSLPNAQASAPVDSVVSSSTQPTEPLTKQPEAASTATASPETTAPAALAAPVLPTTSTPLQAGNGFSVVAPDDAKSALTAMLAAATSPMKLAELKGVVDLLQKPASGDRKVARIFNEKGIQYLRQSQFGEAISIFQQGLVADASDAELRNNYVYALLQAKKYSEAENEAGILLSQNPGRAAAWSNLAEIYAGKGSPQESARALIVALQFSSNKEKMASFIKDKSASPENPQLQEAAKIALQLMGD